MIDSIGTSLLNQELQSGERIVWSGQPVPSILFTKADFFLIPFSILWFGFALFWEGSALFMIPKDQPVGLLFPLFGSVFVLFGFYYAIGRFIYKYHRKKNTYYALTNTRVLIISKLFGKQVQGALLKDIPTISKSVNGKGIGSLVFGNQSLQAAMYSNTGMDLISSFNQNPVPAFYDFAEVEVVYKKINELIDH